MATHSLAGQCNGKKPEPSEQVTDDPEESNEQQLDELKAEYEATKPRVLEDVTTDPIPHKSDEIK